MLPLATPYSDLDGLGREFRVRPDTFAFHGFVLSTSYGQDALAGDDSPLYDVAATYDGQFDLFDLDGAIAYPAMKATTSTYCRVRFQDFTNQAASA